VASTSWPSLGTSRWPSTAGPGAGSQAP